MEHDINDFFSACAKLLFVKWCIIKDKRVDVYYKIYTISFILLYHNQILNYIITSMIAKY